MEEEVWLLSDNRGWDIAMNKDIHSLHDLGSLVCPLGYTIIKVPKSYKMRDSKRHLREEEEE